MKKKEPSKRILKNNIINYAILSQWWALVRAVEQIRADPRHAAAIFELGVAMEHLTCMSVEFGIPRLLKAMPAEQRDLLDGVLLDGRDRALDAFERNAPLFKGMDFPSSHSIFELISELAEDSPRNRNKNKLFTSKFDPEDMPDK
jgi:hypothetical protein